MEKEKKWPESLEQIADVLESSNVTYFLDTGTLLGAVRDGQFIPWDNDIDIGIILNGEDKKLADAFDRAISLGFEGSLTSNGMALFSKSGVEVNLKSYQLNGDHYHADFSNWKHPSVLVLFLYNVKKNLIIATGGRSLKAFVKATALRFKTILNLLSLKQFEPALSYEHMISTVPKKHFWKLGTIEFYARRYPAPAFVNEYLTMRYGADWNTPKKDYNYVTDDLSIQNGALLSDAH